MYRKLIVKMKKERMPTKRYQNKSCKNIWKVEIENMKNMRKVKRKQRRSVGCDSNRSG